MLIKIIILLVFFAIMVYIGFITRKHAKNVNDFVLGGRTLGPWLTAFAYGTTYFSAVVFVGYAGQFGWKFGLSATWIGIGNALIGSLLAWIILGRRTRIMTKHLESKTMPDFFGKRFDSKALKIAAALITFIFLIPYTSSVYTGLSKLFEMAFHIQYIYCVIGMAVLTGIYVILGGYMATAWNDFIQGIIMLGGVFVVIASVLAGQGGFAQAFTKLSQVSNNGTAGAFTSLFGPDGVSLLGVVILTSLGTWGLPQLVHKFYAVKDDKAIQKGTIISTIFAIIIAGGSYFLGGFGRLFPAVTNSSGAVAYDAIVPTMLSTLPDVIIGIVVVLVLSASMSTLASLVLTSSSTITLDLIKDNFSPAMKEKKQVLILRLLIAVFIVISVVFAINPPTFIAQLMGISWGALAGSFLAPFLYGLFWKGVTKTGVWAGFISGVGISVLNLAFSVTSPINAGAFAMLAGLIIVPVVSLLSPKFDKKFINNLFACYGKESKPGKTLASETEKM